MSRQLIDCSGCLNTPGRRADQTHAGRKAAEATRRVPEFLGPNAELKDLPVIAVVGLGAIQVGDK